MREPTARRARPFLPYVVALVIGAVAAGCGKDDPPLKPQPPFQYPALDTPQHVVLNVKYSWERRDSVRTREIYDDAYQGTSTDYSGTLTFTKSQEVGVVWAMGKNQDITNVSFNLPPEATWIRMQYPSDPAGWTAIQFPNVNIQVEDVINGTQIANTSSFFEFKLAPTVDSSSPTDTTWKIIRWTEVKN